MAFAKIERFSLALDWNVDIDLELENKLMTMASWAEAFPSLRSFYLDLSDFDVGWIRRTPELMITLGLTNEMADHDIKAAAVAQLCQAWHHIKVNDMEPGDMPPPHVDFYIL